MRVSEAIMDRRKFWKALGWGIIGTMTITTFSDIARRFPFPRILPERITRTVGDTASPIPEPWINALPRVSVEGMPLDKNKIDSLPMLPVGKDGYCKTGAVVQKLRYGITIPDMYEELGLDYSKTGGRVLAEATDGYALIPKKGEDALFSADPNNLPKKVQFEEAQRLKMTPYGCFLLDDKAWHKLSDCYKIDSYRGEAEPGTHFVGPDGNILKPLKNNSDSMTFKNLVLRVNNVPIPYSKIKRLCEEQSVVYNSRELPSIELERLVALVGLELEGKAIIAYANNYVISAPANRLKGARVLFDEEMYTQKYGTPAKLFGMYLNNAAQIAGIKMIEVVSMPG